MSGRIEIITGPERRRRWSEEEKLQFVEEACRSGGSVSQVARQRGINPSQLFTWRRQARAKGLVSDARCEPSAPPALTFSRVRVAEESTEPDPSEGFDRYVDATSLEVWQGSRSSSRTVSGCAWKFPPMLLSL